MFLNYNGHSTQHLLLCKFLRFVNIEVSVPIMTRAGTAFHSSQNVMKDDVTNMMPGMNTVVK
jgi:hypothetical protein